MTTLSREERWLSMKQARESANLAHPFRPNEAMDPGQLVFEDETDSSVVLVAFPGDGDRLSIPATDFFSAVTVPCRRIYVRRMTVPFEPHALGSTVEQVRDALLERIGDARRSVFVGTSLGGYQALLYGTLCGAQQIFTVNATSTLVPDVLETFQDHRYDSMRGLMPADYLARYADIPRLWLNRPAPRVTAHFPYRDDALRRHAEHIAEQASVSLVPHYERVPMYKLLADGTLRDTMRKLLSDDG